MSTGSIGFQLYRLAVLSLLGFLLEGCYSDNLQASIPISQIDGNSNMTSSTSNVVLAMPRNEIYSSILYNRNYGNIQKGSYGSGVYTVKRGDTLFYIAWITGNDFRDLAQRNNILAPYNLSAGQTLQVGKGNGHTFTGANAITAADATQNSASDILSSLQIKFDAIAQQPVITYSDKLDILSEKKLLISKKANNVATNTVPITIPSIVSRTANITAPVRNWHWPVYGKIIDNFSAAEGGNKGIDIAGSYGQHVLAAASGRVVYAGSALRGYGNLIIIKHNDDYLSAYAHNDKMLVREQQEVKVGQKIATMGSTGTSSVRLHFEIRYKGKSVNPLRYLSQR